MVQFRANADKLPVLGSPTAVLIDGIEPQSRVGVVHGCVTLGSAALPMLVIIACLGPDGITSPTAENLFPFAIRTLGKVGAVHALRLPENRAGQITGIFITGCVKRRPQRDLRSGHSLPLPYNPPSAKLVRKRLLEYSPTIVTKSWVLNSILLGR